MRLFIFWYLIFFLTPYSFAMNKSSSENFLTQVYSKSGNIYYSQSRNHVIQITHSGKDSSPILSSNKKMIAFIRIGNQVIPKRCDANTKTETEYGNQVWIYDIRTKKERLLVKNNFQCNQAEKQIIDPSDLLFSPDNKILYFITSAWVTSGALHAININGTKEHYITSANSFEVVTKGEDKGYLIVYQHRYFIGGGTYDWYWLISPNGKAEWPIGPEITKDQRDFIESNA
ncbi:MAG: hypothetical protein A3E83_00120 [Gammaproteobacteria bacterium RIFCSPHIGHO2_12_FULL_41_20]|nr:MAG: hypothetical protein A3E83_00120 [Gammaproteobacteria bacterium RIFCSPHIGHO2_12_FULL_41_20]